MNPKTKAQKDAVKINNIVDKNQVSNQQLVSMINCISFPAFPTKDEYICGCCGKHHKGGETCPHCGAKMHYDDNLHNKRKYHDYWYSGLHTKVNGHSVDRIFLFDTTYWKGRGYKLSYIEIVRYIDDFVFSASLYCLGKYAYESCWCPYGTIELRGHTNRHIDIASKYCTWAKRKTVDSFVHGKPQLFTIAQCHPDDFKFWVSDTHSLMEYWPVIKVAYRHGVEIDNDYIRYLRKLKIMGHPMTGYYPKLSHPDLLRFHDMYNEYMIANNTLCRRNHEIAERERIQHQQMVLVHNEELRNSAKRERMAPANYVRTHKQFFNICMMSENLVITPLKSVKEFKEEGSAMHHCVGSTQMGYYRKKDSLVLSARDADGKRLATVEWDLVNHMVLQCLAACNAVPPRQKEIIDLVTTTMNQFNTNQQIA